MRLTRDDERARRICSLAIGFMNAKAPVPSSDVARDFYPDLAPDSFRRAFLRDREALAACGVVIEERGSDGGESLWGADEGCFARGAELGALEAAALEVACQPLLGDPGFSMADELRLALAKLTRAFAEAGVVASPPRHEPRSFTVLRSCLLAGHAASISYTDAHGVSSERLIAPYGLFELRGVRYLVAARIGEGGAPEESSERTYRLDRVSSAEERRTVSFEVPADFCVDDWRRLPFQMGDPTITARFEIPRGREQDLRRAAGVHGTFELGDDVLVWEVPASSEAAAASWAVAQGIRPLAPEGLVSAWEHVLEGVAGDAS